MTKLDDLIEEALSVEDRDILDATAEQGWFELGLSQFSGRLGWVTWLIMVLQVTMFLIGFWCAYQFYNSSELLPALKWGISGAVMMLMGIIVKMSLVPQMQADRILRELKRLELILAKQRSSTSD
ncbi:MAG: DUF6768 family protein [Pseudomonadota bacterium]